MCVAYKKRGMDSKEFETFVMNLIVLQYPHEKKKPGIRAMLTVDSGPRRMNLNLLTMFNCLEFILYPCVLNTM